MKHTERYEKLTDYPVQDREYIARKTRRDFYVTCSRLFVLFPEMRMNWTMFDSSIVQFMSEIFKNEEDEKMVEQLCLLFQGIQGQLKAEKESNHENGN